MNFVSITIPDAIVGLAEQLLRAEGFVDAGIAGAAMAPLGLETFRLDLSPESEPDCPPKVAVEFDSILNPDGIPDPAAMRNLKPLRLITCRRVKVW